MLLRNYMYVSVHYSVHVASHLQKPGKCGGLLAGEALLAPVHFYDSASTFPSGVSHESSSITVRRKLQYECRSENLATCYKPLKNLC